MLPRMAKKGLTIFVTCLAIIAGTSWYKIYLPLSPKIDGVTSKVFPFVMELCDLIGRTGDQLGISSRIKIFRAMLSFSDWIDIGWGNWEEDITIKDKIIAGVPVTIFHPISLEENPPVVIHFHGGGFVFGSKYFSYRKLSILFAKGTKSVVITVDYRLAPENIFPAQFDDGFSVVSTVLNEPTKFGIDGNRVALAGDSAGGLLSAAISLEIAKQSSFRGKIAAQVLMYPWLQMIDMVCLPSYKDNSKGFVLSQETIAFYASLATMGNKQMIQAYIGGNVSNYFMQTPYWKYLETAVKSNCKSPTEKSAIELPISFINQVTDQRLSPLLAKSLVGTPPTFVAIAEYDILASEGMLFTDRLKVAGIPVVEKRYKSYHAFVQNAGIAIGNDTLAREAMSDMVDFLTSIFHKNL